ncbi:SRPBCC family protein [Mycobacterium palustre]|uniref:SRPBCC family protein n=1 Tax=Mycobacterium palustre TaxID=153971 RepID=UPI00114F4B02|nr:SRPBCC family protein [Mycobacterium palustre]MCV7102012.1 SRPBCC family protein [Mycobacterium palustre]
MTRSLVVDESRVVPVPAELAFHRTLPAPLPEIFKRWHGPFPPIKAVSQQTGAWDAAGQTRTVHMVGGGSVREELTSVDPPRSFGYRLGDVKGPMALLVDHVVGEWIFEPVPGGTRVTWRWDIHAKSRVSGLALPLFGRLWKGYARQVLEDLSATLTA